MKKLIILVFSILSFFMHAQDIILKTNGDSLAVKVLEVGTNAVSFKKFNYLDGPIFTELRRDIRLIRYSNGDVQQFTPFDPSHTKADSLRAKQDQQATKQDSASSAAQGKQEEKVRIEHIDDKFTINGQPAKLKDVDRQLGKSKNPAVILPLKAAKMMKTANKISKIASYPSLLLGGPLLLVKGIDLWNDVQRGRTTSASYKNALLGLFSTITFPITNKILKKKSDKMYDKIIDMYNVTN